MLRLVFSQYKIYREIPEKKKAMKMYKYVPTHFPYGGFSKLQTFPPSHLSSPSHSIRFKKLLPYILVLRNYKELGLEYKKNYFRFTWSSVEATFITQIEWAWHSCVVLTQRAISIPDSRWPIGDSDTLTCTLCFTKILASFLGVERWGCRIEVGTITVSCFFLP